LPTASALSFSCLTSAGLKTVVTRASRACTGNALLCEDVLAEEGVTDFDAYAYVAGATPQADLLVDHV
jgi:citronellol/citronellal dehydrogenase